MTSGELLYSAIGSSVTIVGVIINHYLKKDEKKQDENSLMRLDLKTHCDKLEGQIDSLRTEIDEWQKRYYNETVQLKEQNMEIKLKLEAMSIQWRDAQERFLDPKVKALYK